MKKEKETKTVRTSLSISDDKFYAELQKRAKKEGQTVSAYTNGIIRKYCSKLRRENGKNN
jgi:hypothetical protein